MPKRKKKRQNKMRIQALILGWCLVQTGYCAPQFQRSLPAFQGHYALNSDALCATAQNTLAYLHQGSAYDPQVIHQSRVAPISEERIRATLAFICQHQTELNNPAFIKAHFDFIRWLPDLSHALQLSSGKPLLQGLPKNRILMTKYYVHLAHASMQYSAKTPYALYGLPEDERYLTIEEANAKPGLLRFKYGKQAILAGALKKKPVPVLAYLNREDLEAALLQGTIIADFGSYKKTFNVHRVNNIAYDRSKNPYTQERFWYFKEVEGIKGYGKDAEHKITVRPEATFAADLAQFGLGSMLFIQYKNAAGEQISRAGILADTGGAFDNNLYQIDYLAGSYAGTKAFAQANRHLPDYVSAYFMVLKNSSVIVH